MAKKKKIDPQRALKSYATDPYGSYTGNHMDEQDQPVQDADDL